MEEDPFESLLGLEDTYYQEGYDLGVADGSVTGRTEGRIFGLEKGFEKFIAVGALHGRATIWSSQLVGEHEKDSASPETSRTAISGPASADSVPKFPLNPRLEKHIKTLYELVEPASLSTQNTEETVADFDDRLRRAGSKAKVIEKIIGTGKVDVIINETGLPRSSRPPQKQDKSDNMEDFGV